MWAMGIIIHLTMMSKLGDKNTGTEDTRAEHRTVNYSSQLYINLLFYHM